MDFKDQATLLDLVVRVFCLEKFLIEKNIVSKEEYGAELNKISEQVMKDILKNVKYEGSYEDFVAKIKNSNN
jgi:hypothetical protein